MILHTKARLPETRVNTSIIHAADGATGDWTITQKIKLKSGVWEMRAHAAPIYD